MNNLTKSIVALGTAYGMLGIGGCSQDNGVRNMSTAEAVRSLDAIAESSSELELDSSKINKNLMENEVFKQIISDKNFDGRGELLYFFDNILVASNTTDRYNLNGGDGLSLTWAICKNKKVSSELVFLYSYYAGKEYMKNNYSNIGNMTHVTRNPSGLITLELTPQHLNLGKNYGAFSVNLSIGNTYWLIIEHVNGKGKVKATVELKKSEEIKNESGKNR